MQITDISVDLNTQTVTIKLPFVNLLEMVYRQEIDGRLHKAFLADAITAAVKTFIYMFHRDVYEKVKSYNGVMLEGDGTVTIRFMNRTKNEITKPPQ